MLRPIETRYKGYRFRSRLEARWAVFFDALGVAWEYEREGYDLGDAGWYLPDFWLPVLHMFGEVKPAPFATSELAKARALAAQSHYPVLQLVGVPRYAPYAAIDFCAAVSVLCPHTGSCPGWFETDYVLDDQYIDSEYRFFVASGYRVGTDLEREHWWQSERTRAAYDAARGARFEHGEDARK